MLFCGRKKLKKSQPIFFLVTLLSLAYVAACANTGTGPIAPPTLPSLVGDEDVPPPPPLDPERVAQGQVLYALNCAECHGANGEGQPNWKIPNDDGSYKSPPHDASGHTWHHADELLLDLIANGSDFPETRMPTFGDSLSDEEILAILEYIKTWWGPEERAFQWQVTWQARQQE